MTNQSRYRDKLQEFTDHISPDPIHTPVLEAFGHTKVQSKSAARGSWLTEANYRFLQVE